MRVTGDFLVYDEKLKRKVLIADVVKIEGCINYSLIYLVSGAKKMSSRTIGLYDKELTNFVRVHRNVLLNKLFIIGFVHPHFILKNGEVIKSSRRKLQVIFPRKKIALHQLLNGM